MKLSAVLPILLLSVGALMCGCASQTPSPLMLRWGAEVLISDEDNAAALSALISNGTAVVGNTVHLVWASAPTQASADVYYKRSDDGGRAWSQATRLTFAGADASEATVAARDQNVYVVWRDKRYFADGSIFFKRSLDNGKTWDADVLLSPNNVRSAAPTLALDGDTIYVAWEHYDLGPGNTRLRKSVDGGATWQDPVDVTREQTAKGGGGCPSLSVGAGHQLNLVHCSLKDAGETRNYNWELYFKQSSDGGKTWSDSLRLTDDRIGDSRFPTTAASGGYLHMVWFDDRDDTKYKHVGYPPLAPEPDHNFEVYYKRTTDGGKTWTNDVRLTTADGVAISPSIAVAGNNVYVVWQDNRDGNDEIYFKHSNDNGTRWSDDIRLTNQRAASKFPSLAVDAAGNVYVIWTDKSSGKMEIYFRKGEVAR